MRNGWYMISRGERSEPHQIWMYISSLGWVSFKSPWMSSLRLAIWFLWFIRLLNFYSLRWPKRSSDVEVGAPCNPDHGPNTRATMTPQAYIQDFHTFVSLYDDTYLQWPPAWKQSRTIEPNTPSRHHEASVPLAFVKPAVSECALPFTVEWRYLGQMGLVIAGGGWWKDRFTKPLNFMAADCPWFFCYFQGWLPNDS